MTEILNQCVISCIRTSVPTTLSVLDWDSNNRNESGHFDTIMRAHQALITILFVAQYSITKHSPTVSGQCSLSFISPRSF